MLLNFLFLLVYHENLAALRIQSHFYGHWTERKKGGVNDIDSQTLLAYPYSNSISKYIESEFEFEGTQQQQSVEQDSPRFEKKKYEALRVWEQDKRTTSGAQTIAGNTDA